MDSELAYQILDVCLGIKPGERVWIHSWDHSLDLASDIGKELLNRESSVLLSVQTEDAWLDLVMNGPKVQLEKSSALQSALLEATDAYLFTIGPRSPVPWNKIPAERRKAVTIWFLEDNSFVRHWKAITKQRRVKMLAIEATLATPERAKVLGLNYTEWRRVMFEACTANYTAISIQGGTLASKLSKGRVMQITNPAGTDLRIKLDRRPVLIDDGLATREKAEKGQVAYLPAGNVELTADEASAEGDVVFDVPIRSLQGVIEGLRLHFEKGQVTKFSAHTHGEIFQEYMKGGEDVGKFAFIGFGLNPKLRHGFTQDDKVYGGITIGLGNNSDKGGKNRTESGRSWWASISGASVSLDNEDITAKGEVLIASDSV